MMRAIHMLAWMALAPIAISSAGGAGSPWGWVVVALAMVAEACEIAICYRAFGPESGP